MAAYGSYGLEESAQDREFEERVERHFLRTARPSSVLSVRTQDGMQCALGAMGRGVRRSGGGGCALCAAEVHGLHAFGELWVGSGRSTTWLCTSLSSCNTTTNLQIQKRTSRATESRKKRTSSPTLQRRPAESARREGGRRRETKFSKALLLKGIEDAENIPDTTHFHSPWGRESRKFFSTIESSLYVIQ